MDPRRAFFSLSPVEPCPPWSESRCVLRTAQHRSAGEGRVWGGLNEHNGSLHPHNIMKRFAAALMLHGIACCLCIGTPHFEVE